jgi:hypothetical protein
MAVGVPPSQSCQVMPPPRNPPSSSNSNRSVLYERPANNLTTSYGKSSGVVSSFSNSNEGMAKKRNLSCILDESQNDENQPSTASVSSVKRFASSTSQLANKTLNNSVKIINNPSSSFSSSSISNANSQVQAKKIDVSGFDDEDLNIDE